MTRIAYSDSTLDALAAGRDVGLRWLITDLRRALWYENPKNMTARQTSQSSGELDERGWPLDTDEGGLGPPMAADLHRFLGTSKGTHQRNWDFGPDPRRRPAMASIVDYSARCHARHTSHVRPGDSLSLCARMMFEVAYLGQEPDDMVWLHGLDLEQVERMLLEGFRHARLWREDTTQRLSREPGREEPIPERRRTA